MSDERLRMLQRRWQESGDWDDQWAFWREAERVGRGCEFGLHDVDAGAPVKTSDQFRDFWSWGYPCDACGVHVPVSWTHEVVDFYHEVRRPPVWVSMRAREWVSAGDWVGVNDDGSVSSVREFSQKLGRGSVSVFGRARNAAQVGGMVDVVI